MADQLPTAKELQKRTEAQYSALLRVVGSPDWELAESILIAKFGGGVVVPNDPYATHVRIGERNVVDYLQSLRGD